MNKRFSFNFLFHGKYMQFVAFWSPNILTKLEIWSVMTDDQR